MYVWVCVCVWGCVCACVCVCNNMDTQHSINPPFKSALMNGSLHATKASTANHLTSGNFSNCSRTAFELHIQIHKSDPNKSFTIRTFCVCLNGCYVCTCPFSGFQNISFSITIVYFTDRAKCKTVLLFTHPQTLDGDLSYHTGVAVWHSGLLDVLQFTVCVFQTKVL